MSLTIEYCDPKFPRGHVQTTKIGNVILVERFRPIRKQQPEPQLGGAVAFFGLCFAAYWTWHIVKWALR